MARFSQTIFLGGMNNESALATAYQAFVDLKWDVVMAGQDLLLGHTPKTWKSKGQQIQCTVVQSSLVVTSESVSSELPRFSDIHRNNTEIFINAFNAAASAHDEQVLARNLQAISDLRNVTQQAIARQNANYEELDRAMNLTGSNLYATYTLIGLNVLVFVLMCINGAGIFEPNGIVHLRWGSNFAPLTLSGDWWRLITNTFIHFGAVHLVMNMYCLYSIATYLEPMLGKQRYISAYLCTGILASLVSLWWHSDPANSAGASGAVFGLYGLFLAFLTTRYIPESIRQSLLRSIGIFVLFNLAYGMKSGVDNAAHIGGLASGLVIGYGYVFSIRREKERHQKTWWLVLVMIVSTVSITWFYLNEHKVNNATRIAVVNQIKESSYQDYEKVNALLKSFADLHNSAMEALLDTTNAGAKRVDQLAYIVLPKWKQAKQIFATAANYDVSPATHAKINRLTAYVNLRKQESELLLQMAKGSNTQSLQGQVKLVRNKAENLFRDIIKEGE